MLRKIEFICSGRRKSAWGRLGAVAIWRAPWPSTKAGSVLQWYTSEMRGSGDLSFYAALQVYSALVLLLALLLPQRYTRGSDLAIVVGLYALAKVLETFDKPIFAAAHIIKVHNPKHLAPPARRYWAGT